MSSSSPSFTPAQRTPEATELPTDWEGEPVAYWLSLQEASTWLGRTDRTLQRWMRRGFPHRGRGHELRIPFPHAVAWAREFHLAADRAQSGPRQLPFFLAIARYRWRIAEWEARKRVEGTWV